MKRQRRTRGRGALANNDDAAADDAGPLRRGSSGTGEDGNELQSDAAEGSMLPPSDGSGGESRPSVPRKRTKNRATSTNDNGGGSTAVVPPPRAKKTLFSAVMSRSNGSLEGNGKSSPSKFPPQKFGARDVSINDASSNDGPHEASTPQSKPSAKGTLPRSPFSPGEYGILRALDDANDLSAYYQQQPQPAAGEEGGEEEANPGEEWYDAAVRFRNGAAEGEDGGRGKSKGEVRTEENLADVLNAEVDSNDGEGKDPLPSSIVEAARHGMGTEWEDGATTKGAACPDPCGIGVMDWSLKNRMRLQCIPGRCLPNSLTSSGGGSEGWVHRLALQHLSNGGDGDAVWGRNATAEESAAAKWLAGTMYYQHPAVHPLPPSLLEESNTGGNEGTSRRRDLSSFVQGGNSIHRRVRLPAAGCMGGLGASVPSDADKNDGGPGGKRRRPPMATVPSLLEQRRREWQGAFRGMHRAWMAGLRSLEEGRADGGKTPAPDALARCCFYSILPHQVVLFRGGYAGGGVGSPRSTTDDVAEGIVPVIVFSSTTPRLRSKLASMGVRLRVLAPRGTDGERGVEGHELFSEDMLRPEEAQAPTGRSNEGDAEVHAELDAIKWADDEKGKVTVNLKKKSAKGSASGADVPPLFVSGHDDCAGAYELLVNTYGFSTGIGAELARNGSGPAAPVDVPLLLCRSLGPCEHAALRTLSLSSRRDCGHMRQMQANASGIVRGRQPSSSERAGLELRGPILPCALRDLTCAMVHWTMLGKRASEKTRNAGGLRPRYNNHRDADGDATAGAGSHQFAMFLQSHEGERSVLGPTSTGTSSSLRFNGSNVSLLPREEKGESTEWHECMHGDSINVLVYDTSRESVVSFNPSSSTTS